MNVSPRALERQHVVSHGIEVDRRPAFEALLNLLRGRVEFVHSVGESHEGPKKNITVND